MCSSDLTITAWTKITELDSNWKEIISTKNYGLRLWGDDYTKDPNRIHSAYWYRGDVWIEAELDAGNQWHLIVVPYDGQEFALYIDGRLCASQCFHKSIAMGTGRLYIGQTRNLSNEGWKDGLIDDVRIYSYALNAEEVKMLYEGKEPPRAKVSD